MPLRWFAYVLMMLGLAIAGAPAALAHGSHQGGAAIAAPCPHHAAGGEASVIPQAHREARADDARVTPVLRPALLADCNHCGKQSCCESSCPAPGGAVPIFDAQARCESDSRLLLPLEASAPANALASGLRRPPRS